MAVEATHLNLFPSSQLLQDRELVTTTPYNQGNNVNPQPTPFSGTAYGTTFNNNNSPLLNTESSAGLRVTFNNINQRKRSRELMNQFYGTPSFVASPPPPPPPQKTNNNDISMFVGGDFLPQIQQNQLEIHHIINQHTAKIRLELEERQKQQAKLLASAIGQGVMKRIKEKEEQIQRIAKSNLFLQEKVKSLYVENQLWRDLAQSNEATANNLRSNLEQVMSQIVSVEEEEDVESCCGSNGGDEEEEEEESDMSRRRMCRNCGERESCVLVLPCRHLCLCNFCGGSGSHQLQACPVCNTIMNATLHVNMSS